MHFKTLILGLLMVMAVPSVGMSDQKETQSSDKEIRVGMTLEDAQAILNSHHIKVIDLILEEMYVKDIETSSYLLDERHGSQICLRISANSQTKKITSLGLYIFPYNPTSKLDTITRTVASLSFPNNESYIVEVLRNKGHS